ncbi:signal peptidase I [Rhodococcus sovatensis]|uniref:Signal peptidase I n=1 Tax=Rhodococcus sovatensis TaxID=1805840 RepID=A0ABZ2PDW9_9NOCA
MSNHTSPATAHTKRRRRKLAREIALTAGAVAGLFCVLVALAAVVFGITPLVFRSGSMSPAIDTGALAISKQTPATEIEVGDIVNVTNASGEGITHRVVEIGAVGTDSVQLVLRGDANTEADAETYIVAEVGRVVFSVPNLGYAVTWMSGPVAVFLGGVFVGVLLMIAWRPRTDEDRHHDDRGTDEPGGSGGHSKATLTAILAIGAVGALGLAATNTPTTLAAWNDPATATSGTFTTGLPPVPVPGDPTCVDRAGSFGVGAYVTMSWAPPPGSGYTYRWTITRLGTSLPPHTVNIASADVHNGTWFETLTGTWTFTVQTVSGTRVSAPSRGFTVTMTLTTSPLNLFPAARCGALAPASAPAVALMAPEEVSSSSTAEDLSTSEMSTSAESSVIETSPTETTEITGTTETVLTETSPTETVPTETVPTEASPTEAESPAALAPETSEAAPTTTEAAPTTTEVKPADLITPQTSPSGASVAKVVDIGGSPTLQITDTADGVQYSALISSSSEYGYGVVWGSGGQLWLLGSEQLVRLDNAGSSWTRTVIDASATDEIPADIAALLN